MQIFWLSAWDVLKKVVILSFVAVLVSACSTGSGKFEALPAMDGETGSISGATTSAEALKSRSKRSPDSVEQYTAGATPGSHGYKIGPADVIEVAVFKVPELQKVVQVSERGSVNLPLVGELTVASRTAQEVERDLAARLGKKYLKDPQVTVMIREYNSQRITLEGAFRAPAVLPMRGKTTLMQVVAQAGGLSDLSDNTVVVFRTENGHRAAAKFDVAEIRTGKAPDPALAPGDVVHAPTSATKEALNSILKVLPLATMAALL